MNKYMFTDGKKSIDLPQYPNEAWHFYGESDDEDKEDLYGKVASVFRATNLTASATSKIPFILSLFIPVNAIIPPGCTIDRLL